MPVVRLLTDPSSTEVRRRLAQKPTKGVPNSLPFEA